MPEHTSFFSYLVAMFPALGHNAGIFGKSFLGHQPVSAHGIEPLVASLAVMLLIAALVMSVQPTLVGRDKAVLPESKLTLHTFFEVWVGYWYGLMRDMMGPKRAKRFAPLIISLTSCGAANSSLGRFFTRQSSASERSQQLRLPTRMAPFTAARCAVRMARCAFR